jgi:hypothetical protein
MTNIRRTSRRLRSITAVASFVAATAVLVLFSAQATVTFGYSSNTLGVQENTPSGAVGGVQSPAEAGSILSLKIDAGDAGSGLMSARASIGGNTTSVSLCSEFPCPETVSDVSLSVEVGGVGLHVLLVTVTDAAGNTATLLETPIEVLAPPPPGSNTVTVGISAKHDGSPTEGPPEEPGHKHPPEEGLPKPPVCPSPMLEMRLASRPVGYTRQGVPTLRRGRLYRFTGGLTCLRGRRRVWAPDGTSVRVLYQIGRRTFTAGRHTMLVHRGSLSAMLTFKSARTTIFRYSQTGGENVEVRIRTAIAHRNRRDYRSQRRG